MDKRKQALSILKQARELLTDRLIENLVESADGFLEDAEGCSYMDEIEGIQEKIGGRLNSVNVMLANFPVVDPMDKEPRTATPNAPAPRTDRAETGTAKPEKFALFVQQVTANDMEAAGHTLAELLDVSQRIGSQCAESFRERLNEDPTTIQQAMRLRAKLMAGENNDSLMILWDCFRLQGPQAVEVLQTLKTSLPSA